MGVYAFSAAYLKEILNQADDLDFGKDIVPKACTSARTFAYPFKGYWRDVGTLEAYWEANLDLLQSDRKLDPEAWKIYPRLVDPSRIADRPPTFIGRSASGKSLTRAHGRGSH